MSAILNSEEATMDVFAIFEKLEATPGRLEKEKILKENLHHKTLKALFLAALDPYTTYGVAKFPKPTPMKQTHSYGILHFRKLLDQLSKREVTGNGARLKLELVFMQLTALEQKWGERILLKNLRCGATATIVNKIWPRLIPTFEVQLAETLETSCSGSVQSVVEVPYIDPYDSEKKQGTKQTKDFEIVSEVKYPVWVDPK